MTTEFKPLAKLNRPVTLWDIGWALFRYWEMKAQLDIPEYPTESQRAELGPERLVLVDAFPGVTKDEAFAAWKALGFGFCRARGSLHPCLDRDECCPEVDGVDDARAHAALHAREVVDRCQPVIDADEQPFSEEHPF